MRRIHRPPLPDGVQAQLDQKQFETDRIRQEDLRVVDLWRAARQTNLMRTVLDALHNMTGERERCMYCLDSHGADIEHFWPKTPYPDRMFTWQNLLLCCAECGRFKGDQFPLSEGQPLLVDPTAEQPWLWLDFDPATGNIVARFDVEQDDWSPKGSKTVEILKLDRREALAAGYCRTFRRLSAIVERHLKDDTLSADPLIASLKEADDHGLLGWCLVGTGKGQSPFRELSERQPEIWAALQAAFL